MVRRRTMESSRTQIFPRQIHTRYFTRAPSHPRDIADVISGQGQWKAHRQTGSTRRRNPRRDLRQGPPLIASRQGEKFLPPKTRRRQASSQRKTDEELEKQAG